MHAACTAKLKEGKRYFSTCMSVLYKLIPACIDMHVHATYSKIGHAIKGKGKGKGKTVLASEKVITLVM
jgi:hypothetical protein